MSEIKNTGTFAVTADNERYEFDASCVITGSQDIKDLISTSKTVDNAEPTIGDVVTYTYTVVVGDVGESITFQSFADSLATGLQFVDGSVVINGEAKPDLEIYYFETDFVANTTNTIEYQCLVVS